MVWISMMEWCDGTYSLRSGVMEPIAKKRRVVLCFLIFEPTFDDILNYFHSTLKNMKNLKIISRIIFNLI